MVTALAAIPTMSCGAIDPHIQIMLARRTLLGVPSQELKHIAITWIEQGHDCPSLHELAWEPILTHHEAEHLFTASMAALGFQAPSAREAADMLVRHHLSQIVSGTVAPEEGLHAMMQKAYWPEISKDQSSVYVGDNYDLQYLIGAYWNYEDLATASSLDTPGLDVQACLKALNDDVRKYAAEWLSQHPAS